MARMFTSREAKELLQHAEHVTNFIEYAANLPQTYREGVLDAAKDITARVVLEQLSQIPIEDLNRGGNRIRTGVLRESGYRTYADVAGKSTSELEGIPGVGRESAGTIYEILREYVDQLSQGVRVKLSLDDKNPQATNLVLAISKLRRSLPHGEKAASMKQAVGESVFHAAADLRPGTRGLGWYFTGAAKREGAKQAYTYLTKLLSSPLGGDVVILQQNVDSIVNLSTEDAWKDFEAQPVSFYNILENLAPGLLGGNDTFHGLPEKLAEAVAGQALSLDGLACELRTYQLWGVRYILKQKRVLLGDEMGLGKTVQAIAAMVSLRNEGKTHFLVVCPASVLSNWVREIQRFSDLTPWKMHGDQRASAFTSWKEQGGVLVTNYENTGHVSLEEDFRFDMLTVDEAHYIKNPNAKRTERIRILTRRTDYVLFMTGTALENRVEEMVSLVSLLNPKSAEEIQALSTFSAAPKFREKIAPVYYRRKREDVLTELPDLVEKSEWCMMTQQDFEAYAKAVYSRNIMSMRRVSWNVPDLSDSSKGQRLKEIISWAKEEGRKVIVFSFFLETLAAVSQLMREDALPEITGSVSLRERQSILDRFEEAPAGTVLPAQIQAGGTGLNIQCASVVVFCEPQIKPSLENQAISRAYRMGQTRDVFVYWLLCDDSIDERMLEILEEKQNAFNAFADFSEAAKRTENLALDDARMKQIMEEEFARIEKMN